MYISGVARGPKKKTMAYLLTTSPALFDIFILNHDAIVFVHDGWPTFTCIPVRKHPKIFSDIPKKNTEQRTGPLSGVPFFHNPITKNVSVSRKKRTSKTIHYIHPSNLSIFTLFLLDPTFNKCTKALTSRSSFFGHSKLCIHHSVGMGVGCLGWRVDTDV